MREKMSDQNESEGILSPRGTRLVLLVTVPLILVIGIQTVSWAVPKVWTSGETLTAADLNSNFASLDDAFGVLNRPNPWTECGFFEDLRDGTNTCEVNGYPTDQYEYGFKYNGKEVHVADDPTNGGMQLGGSIFYTETNAADDDVPGACPANTWRHRYWRITDGNVVLDLNGNGCTNMVLYCRRR